MIINRVMPIMHICYWLTSVCSGLGNLPIASVHCTLCTVYTVHCNLCTRCMHCYIVYTAHCKLSLNYVHCTLCTLHTVDVMHYCVQCMICSLWYAVYDVQFIICNIQYANYHMSFILRISTIFSWWCYLCWQNINYIRTILVQFCYFGKHLASLAGTWATSIAANSARPRNEIANEMPFPRLSLCTNKWNTCASVSSSLFVLLTAQDCQSPKLCKLEDIALYLQDNTAVDCWLFAKCTI